MESASLNLSLREGDVDKLRLLLHTITFTQSDLDLALLQSILLNHDDVVHVLLEAGANVNTQDEEGRTPFYLTLLCHRLSLSTLLLEYGCDVDVCKTNQSNALHYASKLGDLRLLQLLVAGGARLNVTNWGGNTAVLIACRFGHRDVVQFLIECGARIDICNRLGHYPLHYAAYYDDIELINVLINHGARGDCHTYLGVTPLMLACQRRKCSAVNTLSPLSNLEYRERLYGGTALFWAIHSSCKHCLKTLLDQGADPDARDNSGRSILLQAIQSNAVSILELLLTDYHARYARSLLHKPVNHYALHFASFLGYKDCVTRLLASPGTRPFVDLRDMFGDTPVTVALRRGHVTVARLLVQEYGARLTDDVTTSYTTSRLTDDVTASYTMSRLTDDVTASYTTSRLTDDVTASYTTSRVSNDVTASYTTSRVSDDVTASYTTSRVSDDVTASYTTSQLHLTVTTLPPLRHDFFKTYSSVKMGMINLLQSSDEVQIVAPVSSAGFDFNSWLDHGPDAFNLKVTSLELTDWLKTHMKSPLSLRECCRGYLRRLLGYRASDKVETLSIPTSIKNFINMKELSDLRAEDITIGNIKSHPWVDIE